MITVDSNYKEVAAHFRQEPQILKKWLIKALNASVQTFQKNNTRGVTPWETGSLSQTHQTSVDRETLEGRLTPTRSYAPFVYFGTRYQKAQPWLKEIGDRSKDDVKKHFEDALSAAIKELTSKQLQNFESGLSSAANFLSNIF